LRIVTEIGFGKTKKDRNMRRNFRLNLSHRNWPNNDWIWMGDFGVFGRSEKMKKGNGDWYVPFFRPSKGQQKSPTRAWVKPKSAMSRWSVTILKTIHLVNPRDFRWHMQSRY
jgi:hypothetical protein